MYDSRCADKGVDVIRREERGRHLSCATYRGTAAPYNNKKIAVNSESFFVLLLNDIIVMITISVKSHPCHLHVIHLVNK